MGVGVRELKSRLSEYLDRAAAGEVIVVTAHGRPKAVLGPLPGVDTVQLGIEAGWIRAGDGSPVVDVPRVWGRQSVSEVLSEDRSED